MAQKDRSKEVWLVPKRGSLHQTVCLIESIISRGYDNTRWNESKQNNLGNDLRKRGAVRLKRSPSNQSIRTLLASIPQYFGFLYIDSSTTPNTVKLTEAGRRLYSFHKDDIKDIGSLSNGKKNDQLIETSPIILEQFEKLQITNPVILKDCVNIYVFPFRLVLKLLLNLGYLDREELAYFVFSIRNEDELPLVINNIKKFRSQNKIDRDLEINLFKDTHVGNITLVKAPSASYFEGLCRNTGIIDKFNNALPNPGSSKKDKQPAIKIKVGYEKHIEGILEDKYRDAEIYDFGNRLKLWIDYIGNPDRLMPPRDIRLVNKSKGSIIMQVEQNGIMLAGDLVEANEALVAPMFFEEDYNIIFINPNDGSTLENNIVKPDFSVESYEFDISGTADLNNTFDELAKNIIAHSISKTFEANYSAYLGIIEEIVGQDLINNKNLRGAYYEYLFYKFLDSLREEGVIDDVYWNGSIGQYGLPRPAPGGKIGTPDIVFTINSEFFILELTTIKAKSTQFSAEGSSVPDHIKKFYENNLGLKVNGIFSAPLIHDRNTSAMRSILNPLDINLTCITDKNLVELLLTKDRNLIFNQLKGC